MISVKGLTVKYGDAVIISDISFEAEDGCWLMIAGPNGAGKSTMIRAVAQSIPYTGTVLIDGVDARNMKSRDLARKVGVLSQEHFIGYGFTAEEVIRLGGYSRRGRNLLNGSRGKERGQNENISEEEYFNRAVKLTGMEPYLGQSVTQLSGGELQRTFLAQLFAQDPETLILDEPTNHLDLIYQKQIMEMIDEWRRERSRTVISVVHDLSLAKMFGTDALIINKGRAEHFGPAGEVMTGENLNSVYGMDVAGWINSLADVWKE